MKRLKIDKTLCLDRNSPVIIKKSKLLCPVVHSLDLAQFRYIRWESGNPDACLLIIDILHHPPNFNKVA